MKKIEIKKQAVEQFMVSKEGALILIKIENTPHEETCFLPTNEIKSVIGCNNSFLRYCREKDLVLWGKIRNTYHYDLFTFKSVSTSFSKEISDYLGI